jgi:hypothetical protein
MMSPYKFGIRHPASGARSRVGVGVEQQQRAKSR